MQTKIKGVAIDLHGRRCRVMDVVRTFFCTGLKGKIIVDTQMIIIELPEAPNWVEDISRHLMVDKLFAEVQIEERPTWE